MIKNERKLPKSIISGWGHLQDFVVSSSHLLKQVFQHFGKRELQAFNMSLIWDQKKSQDSLSLVQVHLNGNQIPSKDMDKWLLTF